jgi:hypothetical protein
MSGWRDTEGRTRGERADFERARERARTIETIRRRPLRLLRPVLLGLFVLVVVAALVLRMF